MKAIKIMGCDDMFVPDDVAERITTAIQNNKEGFIEIPGIGLINIKSISAVLPTKQQDFIKIYLPPETIGGNGQWIEKRVSKNGYYQLDGEWCAVKDESLIYKREVELALDDGEVEEPTILQLNPRKSGTTGGFEKAF